MYNIITGDEFFKRTHKENLECLSTSDYIGIQTYIESEYPDIDYYKENDFQFTMIIHKGARVFNMMDIYKNSDEYFFIKNCIKLKYSQVPSLVEFPGSHKFFIADQIDGLLLFLHDIIDAFLNKKENNIRKMSQSQNGIFDIVSRSESEYYASLDIIENDGKKRIFRISR